MLGFTWASREPRSMVISKYLNVALTGALAIAKLFLESPVKGLPISERWRPLWTRSKSLSLMRQKTPCLCLTWTLRNWSTSFSDSLSDSKLGAVEAFKRRLPFRSLLGLHWWNKVSFIGASWRFRFLESLATVFVSSSSGSRLNLMPHWGLQELRQPDN